MDKNFIHIDELVRGKLSGLEGQEPPGSWERMKRILDQEMPSKPRGGAAPLWRKRWSYLSGLLLISALATGGYFAFSEQEISESSLGAKEAAMEEKTSSMPLEPRDPSWPAAADRDDLQNTENQVEGGSQLKKEDREKNLASTQNGENLSPSPLAPKRESRPESSRESRGPKLAQNRPAQPSESLSDTRRPQRKSPQANDVHNELTVNEMSGADERGNSSYIAKAPLHSNAPLSPGLQDGAQTLAPEGAAVPPALLTSTEALRPGSEDSNIPENELAEGADDPAKEGQEVVVRNPEAPMAIDEQSPVWRRDTLKRIETRERYSRHGQWRRDTVDMGLAEILRKEESPSLSAQGNPAGEKENLSLDLPETMASQGEILPTEEGEWVPLSNFRVESKASRTHYRKANLFEEMVRNAKFQMGRAKFYPGLVAGVHSSLSKYSLSGFQIGAAGTLSLNEKWGIHTEIRYKHSFNGKVFQDESYIGRLDTTNTQQGSMISYDSVSAQFQYSTVSRFELPLMVSYSMKRWVLLAGGTLSYQMGIDAQDVSKTFNHHFYQGMGSIPLERRSPGIHVSDFGPQWGAGCLLGLGYQVSPAIRLDARYTHPLWNTARSPGARKLSESIFQRPQAEINMHFRFSSNKYKPFREPK